MYKKLTLNVITSTWGIVSRWLLMLQKLRIHADSVIDWIGGQAPVDEPECGFMGERCQPDHKSQFTLLYSPILILISRLITCVCLQRAGRIYYPTFCYRSCALRNEMKNLRADKRCLRNRNHILTSARSSVTCICVGSLRLRKISCQAVFSVMSAFVATPSNHNE